MQLIHIQIGNIVPNIAKECMQMNKTICKNNNVDFIIYKEQFKPKKFVCAGYQAEFIKANILSSNQNVFVCDWDIELFDIPALKISNYPYCGIVKERGKLRPYMDCFISYCNTDNASNLFKLVVDIMEKKTYYLYKYIRQITTNPIPSNYYKHYHTDVGLPKTRIMTNKIKLKIDNKFNK